MNARNLEKILLSIFILFAIFTREAYAQVPPPVVSCDSERNPEYHSLRPYQASPCNPSASETVIACGNDLVVQKKYTASPSQGDCSTRADGSRHCNFAFRDSSSIEIALPDAELPILGNTQLVNNSQNQGTLTDAQKVNEYVSWYLNGTIFRAEDKMQNNLLSFAGPLRKLLPQAIQHRYQVETILEANEKRHDQIVVCANEEILGFFGKSKPLECYDGNGSRAKGDVYRLTDWEGDLSFYNTISNFLVDEFAKRIPFLDRNLITESLGEHWNKRTPPFPWDSRFKDNPQLYLKAYQEWRGKSCILIPIPFTSFKQLFCIDNPLIANKYADLFPYVPFSSTEDRKGKVVALEQDGITTQPQTGDVEIKDVSFAPDSSNPTAENIVYFSHTEEVDKLAEILQRTYLPEGKSGFAGASASDTPFSTTTHCDLDNVRWNSGDDLFGEYRNPPISGNVSYNVSFSCDFGKPDQEGYDKCLASAEDPSEVAACRDKFLETGSCDKEANVGLSVFTKTPKINEVWERLVSGEMGIFKRIYPFDLSRKSQILDLPGVTTANYSSSGDKTLAGDPRNQRSGNRAEIFISHLGGVYEYFLKGIQTALRPKDLAETVVSGITTPALGDQCSAPSPDTSQASGIISNALSRSENSPDLYFANRVPRKMLEIIYSIEAFPYYKGAIAYNCSYTAANVLGLMQIGDFAYNRVVPASQKPDQEERVCSEGPSTLSRCSPSDAIEIATRILLDKVNKWNPATYKAVGNISSKEDIFNSSWRYYGSPNPDNLTKNFARSNVPSSLWKDGNYANMGYGDIVCALMGLCPPYP